MKLYRFEKNDEDRINTIKNGEIFLSKPMNFNDLDDCKIEAIFTPLWDEDTHRRILKAVDCLFTNQSNLYLPSSLIEELHSQLLSWPYDQDFEAIVKMLNDYLREKTGVCCFFSGYPSHPLMWSHYADSHKGFCVEYDFLFEYSSPIHEVVYSSKKLIPTVQQLLFTANEVFQELLTTKSLEWSYEKEWRFVELNKLNNNEIGLNIKLPLGLSLSRIITGDRLDHDAFIEKFYDSHPDLKIITYRDWCNENIGKANQS